MKRHRWEYLVTHKPFGVDFTEWLDSMGDDGWELTVKLEHPASPELIFKRRK